MEHVLVRDRLGHLHPDLGCAGYNYLADRRLVLAVFMLLELVADRLVFW